MVAMVTMVDDGDLDTDDVLLVRYLLFGDFLPLVTVEGDVEGDVEDGLPLLVDEVSTTSGRLSDEWLTTSGLIGVDGHLLTIGTVGQTGSQGDLNPGDEDDSRGDGDTI